MTRSLLPDGYKLFIYPVYRLIAPHGEIPLSPKMGEALAFFVGRRDRRVTMTDLADALYGHDEDGGPLEYSSVAGVTAHLMRRRLRSYGVNPVIDSSAGQPFYVFRGFESCPPTHEKRVSRAPNGMVTLPDGTYKPIPLGKEWYAAVAEERRKATPARKKPMLASDNRVIKWGEKEGCERFGCITPNLS